MHSLGGLLEEAGYPSVPSPPDPYPAPNDPYFNGGYITEQNGSDDGGAIDAIQIECNMDSVRDQPTNRQPFADSLATALMDYLAAHYFANDSFMACQMPTGIAEANRNDAVSREEKSLSLYPNPVGQRLNVSFRVRQNRQIQLLSLKGDVLEQVDVRKSRHHYQFNVADYAPGMYMIRDRGTEQTNSYKVIKK
jgi:hypothetical protein